MEQVFERLDRVVNLDIAGRGIEALYAAARAEAGMPLSQAAGRLLADVPEGAAALLCTGSASRAWITTTVAESDGPAGTAVMARALSLGRGVVPVVVTERGLWPAVGGILTAAGLVLVSWEEAQRARLPGGRLSVAVLAEAPDTPAEAERLLEGTRPALLAAVERPGAAASGVYHNARGVDFGAGKARVETLFAAAAGRSIATLGIGDGGNEIGMGRIAETVRRHVRYGDGCLCGCGAGVGAVTATDVLLTADVSNWGCSAAVAAMAVLLGQPRLLHTPALEAALLRRGVDLGLINSPAGHVDADVDNVPFATHLAVVELLRELAVRAIAAAS